MGIKTNFSCEGHGISLQRGIADVPYISFHGKETEYIWDFDDPRLSIFYSENFGNGDYGIYLNFDKVVVTDVVEKKYLDPLLDYIANRIPEILKEHPLTDKE